MSKNSKQKEPKIDIFVITENGDCIPLKEYTHQLKKKTKEQLAICQKRKVCLEKMIGLSNFKMVCNMVVLGVYLGCFGAFISPDKRVHKIAAATAGLTALTSIAVERGLSRHENKLKKENEKLLERERGLD